MLLRIANFAENVRSGRTAADTVGAHDHNWVPGRRRVREGAGMNVLVTGGSGFIGSHVVDLLVEEGHDVVVIDRVAPSHPNTAATFVQADLVNANEWVHVLNGIDAVSHKAARVGLGLRFEDVTDFVRDNDLATAVLLRELARIRFAGRIILASSMVVYGEGSYNCPACGQVSPGQRSPSRLKVGAF